MGSGPVSRRQFLLGSAGALVALRGSGTAAAARLPRPAASGLDHVVVVTMENRSFDHLLGWLPGADGKQAGLAYTDKGGAVHSTHPLAPDFRGCAYSDPDHSYGGGRIAYDNGACDGFLRNASDRYAIGYYTRDDLPFFGQAAPSWTVCDNYFAAVMGPTLPNRLYLHAARTDRTTDFPVPTGLPTIWDRLAAHGLVGRYYRRNFSFLSLWGAKYTRITRSFSDFLRACRMGILPAVSYVDPAYTLPLFGPGNDDHPPSDIRAGEWFLSQVYNAVTRSPAWPRTLLLITFDEWGGFFDHVPPTSAPDDNAAHSLRGFRVPCLLISPFARRNHVDHGLYDHASILKLIEWRFGLKPLALRDRHANNLAAALDFSQRDAAVPVFSVPRFVAGKPCLED